MHNDKVSSNNGKMLTVYWMTHCINLHGTVRCVLVFVMFGFGQSFKL